MCLFCWVKCVRVSVRVREVCVERVYGRPACNRQPPSMANQIQRRVVREGQHLNHFAEVGPMDALMHQDHPPPREPHLNQQQQQQQQHQQQQLPQQQVLLRGPRVYARQVSSGVEQRDSTGSLMMWTASTRYLTRYLARARRDVPDVSRCADWNKFRPELIRRTIVSQCPALEKIRKEVAWVLHTHGALNLKMKGVVYAIYSLNSMCLYVGETTKSALERFEEHVQAARRLARNTPAGGDATPLHLAMASHGFQTFGVYVLERVQPADGATLRARENYWIQKLRSSQQHGGYNITNVLPVHVAADAVDDNAVAGQQQQQHPQNDHPVAPVAQQQRVHASRDYVRRCQHLAMRVQQHQQQQQQAQHHGAGNQQQQQQAGNGVHLPDYSVKSASRMLVVLTEYKHKIELHQQHALPVWANAPTVNECIRLLTALLTHLKPDHVFLRRRHQQPEERITLIFKHKALGRLRMREIFTLDHVLDSFPPVLRDRFAAPGVAFACDGTLGDRLLNYRAINEHIRFDDDDTVDFASVPCPCHMPRFRKFVDRDSGHVITDDVTVLNLAEVPELVELLARGPKLRNVRRTISVAVIRKDTREAVRRYADRLASVAGILPVVFDEWVLRVTNEVVARASVQHGVVDDDDDDEDHVAHNQHENNNNDEHVSDLFAVLDDPRVRRHMAFVRRYFAITLLDKAANNFAIVCRRHYVQRLIYEVCPNLRPVNVLQQQPQQPQQPQQQPAAQPAAQPAGQSTYVRIDRTARQVIGQHNNSLAQLRVGLRNPAGAYERLPLLGWTVKMHKNPIGARFIAFSSSTTLTRLSRMLTVVLSEMLKGARDLCEAERRVRQDLVQSFFSVNNSAVVSQALQHASRRIGPQKHQQHHEQGIVLHAYEEFIDLEHTIRTYDIDTMYTRVNLEDLCVRVSNVCKRVFKFKLDSYRHEHPHARGNNGATRNMMLLYNDKTRSVRWGYGRNCIRVEHEHVLSINEIMNCVRVLVNNTVLHVGNRLFRQQIGIPMGTNCAPPCAEIYLHDYEYDFISALIAHPLPAPDNTNKILLSFALTMRYLDDLMFVLNPFAERFLYRTDPNDARTGIYPRQFLTLKNTTVSDGHAHFMDLDISATPSGFNVKMFDKRNELHIDAIRYPDVRSGVPDNVRYNIVTTECYRFFRRCSTVSAFIAAVIAMLVVMIRKDYPRKPLLARLRQFLLEHEGVAWLNNSARLFRIICSRLDSALLEH